ncbi:MAG: metalloregulator ArsR/SmtB family transcription factor [Actinomycetota bacterium]
MKTPVESTRRDDIGRQSVTAISISRAEAVEWASWFAAIGDPTRVLILHLLSTADESLTVGEITDRLDVGQSTVSHHLAKLADVGFVHVERVGTASHWRVNHNCLRRFPAAADVVMGNVDPQFPRHVATEASCARSESSRR